jgi:hypothetical protein
MSSIVQQIFDMIDVGLVILNKELRVCYWNRWLVSHSGISAGEIKGASIFDYYPKLNNKKFLRNFKAVITFGNCYFFPQKLYDYIFPLKPESNFASEIDYMQQNCIMGPLRDIKSGKRSIEYVYISIKDVTEAHIYEVKLTDALFSLLEKEVNKKNITPEVKSVLEELYMPSTYDFLLDQDAAEKGEKDMATLLEEQIAQMRSGVKGL